MPIDPRAIQWDQPAQAPAPSGGTVVRNPRLPAQVQGDILGNQHTAVSTAKTQQDMSLDPRRVAVSEGGLAVDKAKVALEQRKMQMEQAARIAQLNSLKNQLRTTWDSFAQGPGATHGLSGLSDYNPFNGKNAAFDAASASLADIGQNAFRTPGIGSQSDKELAAFVQANRPESSAMDDANVQRFSNLENRLGEAYKALGIPYTPYRPKGFGPQKGGPQVIKYDKNGNRIK